MLAVFLFWVSTTFPDFNTLTFHDPPVFVNSNLSIMMNSTEIKYEENLSTAVNAFDNLTQNSTFQAVPKEIFNLSKTNNETPKNYSRHLARPYAYRKLSKRNPFVLKSFSKQGPKANDFNVLTKEIEKVVRENETKPIVRCNSSKLSLQASSSPNNSSGILSDSFGNSDDCRLKTLTKSDELVNKNEGALHKSKINKLKPVLTKVKKCAPLVSELPCSTYCVKSEIGFDTTFGHLDNLKYICDTLNLSSAKSDFGHEGPKIVLNLKYNDSNPENASDVLTKSEEPTAYSLLWSGIETVISVVLHQLNDTMSVIIFDEEIRSYILNQLLLYIPLFVCAAQWLVVLKLYRCARQEGPPQRTSSDMEIQVPEEIGLKSISGNVWNTAVELAIEEELIKFFKNRAQQKDTTMKVPKSAPSRICEKNIKH